MKYLPIISCLISACGAELKQDKSISVIDAKYPTVEFKACNKLYHGLGVCDTKKLDNFKFSVQGYYKGTLMIAYGDNRPIYKKEYVDNELIEINAGKIDKSLVVKILLTPTYETQEEAPFPISGIEGTLYVKVLEEFQNTSISAKVQENTDYSFSLPSDTKTSDVYFEGCGGKYENSKEPVTNGLVNILLSKITKVVKKDPCIISGAVVNGRSGYETTFLVSMYDKRFTPLSLPAIKLDKDSIEITNDEAVSIISLDNEYQIDSKGSFDFDPSLPHILRAITSAGRTTVGNYENGTWKWSQ